MLFGHILLYIALGTLPAEAQPQSIQDEISYLEEMIKDLEKQNLELKALQEQNATSIKQEVLSINKRFFQEKQRYLQVIKELEHQNQELKNFGEKNIETLRQELLTLRELSQKEKEQLEKKNAEAIKQEINLIHQELHKDKQHHLEKLAALDSNVKLCQEKIGKLNEKDVKKFSSEVGTFIASATLPDTGMQTSSSQSEALAPSSLAIFHYRPRIKKQAGYAGVDFLWWKVYEGALDYAIKGQMGASDTNPVGGIGSLKSASFSWDPGYRLYLGYRFPPDFWEIEAMYTYYHSSNHNKARHPSCCPATIIQGSHDPRKTVVGTLTQFTSNAMDKATSNVRLNYNMGDILLGRRFLVSDALMMRILFGGTGLWLDQHFKYTYFPAQQLSQSGAVVSNGFICKGKNNWEFSGGGLRLGLDLEWFMGKGFSLLTDASFAIIYGNYNNHAFNIQESEEVIINLHIHDHRFTCHTKLALMPAWGMHFKHFGFLLYAGYELNLFTNLQEVYHSIDLSTASIDGRPTSFTYGLLGMQGLTAGLKFDF